jgi:hypothetical protein
MFTYEDRDFSSSPPSRLSSQLLRAARLRQTDKSSEIQPVGLNFVLFFVLVGGGGGGACPRLLETWQQHAPFKAIEKLAASPASFNTSGMLALIFSCGVSGLTYAWDPRMLRATPIRPSGALGLVVPLFDQKRFVEL